MEMVFEFILANLPIILCLIVGVGLVVVEIFVPGFGLPGISGIILLIISIALTWINHGALPGIALLVIALALCGISISISLKSAATGRLSKSALILKDVEEPASPADEELREFLGREGVTYTVLRPAGIAEFDGVRLNVVSQGEFLPKDTPVRIEQIEGARVLVRAIKKSV